MFSFQEKLKEGAYRHFQCIGLTFDVPSALWLVESHCEKLLNQHADSDHTGWELLLIDVDFTLVLKEEKLWETTGDFLFLFLQLYTIFSVYF